MTKAAAISPLAPAIAARDLGRRFGGRWALAHIDLAVARGEVLLVAGPNGSGKSTLLSLFAGLIPPTLGTLELATTNCVLQSQARSHPSARIAWRRGVALLSHAVYLYELLTARETIRLWANLLGRSSSPSEIARRLEEVGLEDDADRAVGGFSAGMQKRLAFARVRLIDAPVVLLDEPFSALDLSGTQMVSRWIAADREAGKTVVLTSHDLERAAPVANRALLLSRGQQVWEGAAEELPQALEAAS
ncbi:MAG: ABC transporter ATP-binding protein [Thermoanaerobaculia bacterium]